MSAKLSIVLCRTVLYSLLSIRVPSTLYDLNDFFMSVVCAVGKRLNANSGTYCDYSIVLCSYSHYAIGTLARGISILWIGRA